MPLHPCELGEAALRAWFGFVLEGDVSTNQVNAHDVPLYGYQTADPTGAEQAVTKAVLDEFLRTHTLRQFTVGPDGNLVEISGG